jgi:hypothetical protein
MVLWQVYSLYALLQRGGTTDELLLVFTCRVSQAQIALIRGKDKPAPVAVLS